MKIALATARNAWMWTQGLAEPRFDDAPSAVQGAGFLRTLGGVDAYLALKARRAAGSKAEIDTAVERGDLAVVPAVRGCIYLVPRAEVPWALRCADLLSRRRTERDREKAGVRPAEVEEVANAVASALQASGGTTTQGLRKLLPEGLVRSLGEAGKKVGLSSTLPTALRHLEFSGRIERTLEGGSLDSERYLWRPTPTGVLPEVPLEPAEVHRHFAELYFRFLGLGTPDGFAAWAGLGKRDARAACGALPLSEVVLEELPETYFALEPPSETLLQPPPAGRAALLPFEDNLVHLHDGLAILVDREHHDLQVPAWGRGGPVPLGEIKHTQWRSVVLDGRVVGFWELDPTDGSIVVFRFAEVDPAGRDAIAAEVEATQEFLIEEVGHGRSFSIDSEESLSKRAARLRQLAG